MTLIARRRFIVGLIAAPAIVRASSIMPVRSAPAIRWRDLLPMMRVDDSVQPIFWQNFDGPPFRGDPKVMAEVFEGLKRWAAKSPAFMIYEPGILTPLNEAARSGP